MNLSIPVTERAWAAGFYDGEGCTASYGIRYKSKKTGAERNYQQPKICVSQKDIRVLHRQNKAFGNLGSICGTKFKSRCRLNPVHQLQIDGYEKVMTVLGIMWPYLDEIKREQAKAVLLKCVAEFRSRPKENQDLSKLVIGNRDNKTRIKPGTPNTLVASN